MFRIISTVKTTITTRASSVAAVLRSGLQPMEALRCDPYWHCPEIVGQAGHCPVDSCSNKRSSVSAVLLF